LKLKKEIKLLVAADGGAASGKTTAAKLLSQKYGLNFLSSGLLYRYFAYRLLLKKKLKKKIPYLKKISKNINQKKLKNKKLFNHDVTKHASLIAKSKKVRTILKKYQKNFAKQNQVCIEGRDIGSVICPKADIKLFFKCSLNVRAKRRWDEYRKINSKIKLPEVKKALKIRDSLDINRKYSPLRVLKDSIVIDTSKMSKKEVLGKVSKVIERKLILKYGSKYKRRKK